MVLTLPKTTLFWVFSFFALLHILEKCPVNFSKNSSHCSIHTSCVTPVLIQIATFNPTSKHITERIVISQWTDFLGPNTWYCRTELITENLLRYQFTESFLLTIPKRIWDIVIFNYEISTCLAKYSRAEWYVLIDQLFKESLFLDGSSEK